MGEGEGEAVPVTPLRAWQGEFLNLAYPRPILSKFYSILSLLTYYELKLVPLQSGYDVTHLSPTAGNVACTVNSVERTTANST